MLLLLLLRPLPGSPPPLPQRDALVLVLVPTTVGGKKKKKKKKKKMGIPVPADHAAECQRIIGYDFADASLCAEALNAGPPGLYRAGGRRLRSNDMLSLYGGAVLQERLCRRWFQSGILLKGPSLSLPRSPPAWCVCACVCACARACASASPALLTRRAP